MGSLADTYWSNAFVYETACVVTLGLTFKLNLVILTCNLGI